MKKLFILLSLFILNSCSKTETNTNPVIDETMNIKTDNVNLFDNEYINFYLEYANTIVIQNIEWYVNNIKIQSAANTSFQYSFNLEGVYKIKALVNYNINGTNKSKTIENTFNILSKPHSKVQITKVEILSITNQDAYKEVGTYFCKPRFRLEENNSLGNPIIKYIGDEKTENWGVNSMKYPIFWDMSSNNLIFKIYNDGTLPKNSAGHFYMYFNFKHKNISGIEEDFTTNSTYWYVNLNSYISAKPTTLNLTMFNNLNVKLYLDWK